MKKLSQKNMQKNISLILANTRRSYFYFNEIKKNKINVDTIIFYSKKKSRLFELIKKYPLKKKLHFIKIDDINSKLIINLTEKIKSKFILFSGYSAEIVKNKNLFKKNLIHCHPGLLPKYQGSTVIYYSLIEDKKINVSLFRLTKKIDQGEVLYTQEFKIPNKIISIEKDYDDKIRSKTLISFLLSVKNKIKKKYSTDLNAYYIAHPCLRNILIDPNYYLIEKK